MAVLVPGVAVRSRRPTLLVENDLAVGSWLFRLAVVDDAGLESTPAELVVRVVAPLSPGPVLGPVVGPVLGPVVGTVLGPVVGPAAGPAPVVGPIIRRGRTHGPRTRPAEATPEPKRARKPVRPPKSDTPKRSIRKPRPRKKPKP